MMNIKTLSLTSLMALMLVGCGQKGDLTVPAQAEQPTPNMVGNDRDEHGCIGSAGYQWCEKEKQCIRSWEHVPKLETQEQFKAYCKS